MTTIEKIKMQQAQNRLNSFIEDYQIVCAEKGQIMNRLKESFHQNVVMLLEVKSKLDALTGNEEDFADTLSYLKDSRHTYRHTARTLYYIIYPDAEKAFSTWLYEQEN